MVKVDGFHRTVMSVIIATSMDTEEKWVLSPKVSAGQGFWSSSVGFVFLIGSVGSVGDCRRGPI